MDSSYFINNLRNDVNRLIDNTNKMWFEVLKLVITLSSSSLLITLAIVDKLFPNIKSPADLSIYLIISWVSFFLAVVLAVISKLDDLIFYGNVGRDKTARLKKMEREIMEGKEPETLLPEKDFFSNQIYWGAAAINAFFIGIISLCLAFIEKILPPSKFGCIIGAVIILLIYVNIHLLTKRKT